MNCNGYTKLHASILTSTIWQEDNETRLVWITLLALVDQNGFIGGTAPGIANVARVDLESCRKALANFEAPDIDSRSKEFEGRRIKRVEGGYVLLNFLRYREERSRQERQDYQRRWDKENRPSRPNSLTRKRLTETPEPPRTAPNRPETDCRGEIGGKLTPDKNQPQNPRQNPTNPTEAEAEAEAEADRDRSNADVDLSYSSSGKESAKREGPHKNLLPVRQRLNDIYQRDHNAAWSYLEEHALVELLKRPGILDELDELELSRQRNPGYFPRKLPRLLEDWTGALDNARQPEFARNGNKVIPMHDPKAVNGF